MKQTFNILRRYGFLMLMIFLLLPLFFVNVLSSHDWGGDFAMYLMEAQRIVWGKPVSITPYIFNPGNPVLGPPSYPVGFPLLLAPVVAVSGTDIRALSVFMSLLLFLFSIASLFFFRNYFTRMVTFFLVLLIAYNPWMLMFKMEIMSDIPFAALLTVMVLWTVRMRIPSWKNLIVLGLLSGFLISIRAIGWVFAVAFFMWMLVNIIRDRKLWWTKLTRGAALAAISFIIYYFLNHVVFRIATVEGSSYTNLWETEPAGYTILENLAYYIGVLEHFFNPQNGQWRFASLLLRSIAVVFILLGLFNRMLRKITFLETVFVVYLAVLMVYPYRHSGFRFLLPVFPFLLYYLVSGLQDFRLRIRIADKYKTLVLGILIILLFQSNTRNSVLPCSHILPGPQEAASMECFEYIRSHTPEASVIAFFKPRVLSLYTERRSIANHKSCEPELMHQRFEATGVDYLLIHKKYSDQSIRNYAGKYKVLYSEEWANDTFILYRKNR